MKIKIQKLKIDDDITFILMIMFSCMFLEMVIGISSSIYFIIDFFLLFISVKKSKKLVKFFNEKNNLMFLLIVIMMLIGSFIGALVNHVPALNVIYGLHRYYRGLLFFFCCLACVTPKSIRKTIVLLKYIFWLNVVITLFQFIVGGYRRDFLGGVFGTKAGVNQYTNLFFVIISILCIVAVFTKKRQFSEVKGYILSMLLIAALAEIKFYFFEVLLITVLTFLFTKKDLKLFFLLIVFVVAIIIGYKILLTYFPEFSNLLLVIVKGGLEKLVDLQRHYSNDYDIGRAVVFEYVNKNFFVNEFQKCFGLGMGKIASSRFVDNSFFYVNKISHYDAFYFCYLYIEQGIWGFICFVMFLLSIFIIGFKHISKLTQKYTALLCILISVLMFFLFIYDMSLQGQMVFIAYWMMAAAVYSLRSGDGMDLLI